MFFRAPGWYSSWQWSSLYTFSLMLTMFYLYLHLKIQNSWLIPDLGSLTPGKWLLIPIFVFVNYLFTHIFWKFFYFLLSIMKAAACGTWLGDLITALIVTDMMLQDNLYPNWAPSARLMIVPFMNDTYRGKSLLELWGTTFLHNWQPPLIFVRFISNFLCICSNR